MQLNKRVALVMTIALVSLAGCSGLTGGGGGGGITIAEEQANQGNGTHVYISSGDGLPADTNITADVTFESEDGTFNVTSSTTLNESVDPGEKVYLGGEGEGLQVTVGQQPEGAALDTSQYRQSTTITITLTVDTGDRTAEKTFTFTGTAESGSS